MRVLFPLSLVAVCLSANAARATNILFLPGDAFFAFQLADEKAVARLKSDRPAIVRYARPSVSGYFCGYAGYATLELPRMSKATRDALADAYRRHGKPPAKPSDGAGFPTPIAPPGVFVLVYNADFNWQKHGLGIQYNESWVEDSAKFGLTGDHLRLENYVNEPQAIIRGWRDSKRVAALNADLPKLPERMRGSFGNSPIRPRGPVQFIVASTIDFDALFVQKAGLKVTVIKSGKVELWTANGRKWGNK